MRRPFLVFTLLFLAAAVIVATVSMAGATAAPKSAAAVSSSQSATPQLVMPETSAKPKPSPTPDGTRCIVDICKVDNGVLYHCTAHISNNCCRYNTSQDCVADPNCTFSIPPYCSAVPPNTPPNACSGTC